MDRRSDRRAFLKGAAGLSAAALVPGEALAAQRRRARVADLVIVNGRVLTMNARFRAAEAVAVRDGKVLAAGRTRDIRALAGRRTEVLDAKGGTVMPAINDSHLHLNQYGLAVPPTTIDVNLASLAQIVAAVREAAGESRPAGSWIRGRG